MLIEYVLLHSHHCDPLKKANIKEHFHHFPHHALDPKKYSVHF